MAQFQKGDKRPEKAGRKKGTPNRTTEQIREYIKDIVDGELKTLPEDLKLMNKFQKWQILEKVTKYFLPALNKNDDSIEHSGSINIIVSYKEDDEKGGS